MRDYTARTLHGVKAQLEVTLLQASEMVGLVEVFLVLDLSGSEAFVEATAENCINFKLALVLRMRIGEIGAVRALSGRIPTVQR